MPLKTFSSNGDYNIIDEVICNVFPDKTGELITGRVTDVYGRPVPKATVSAQSGSERVTSETNGAGIYSLLVAGGKIYDVSVEDNTLGYVAQVNVPHSASRAPDHVAVIGNKWGLDFTIVPRAPAVPDNVNISTSDDTGGLLLQWNASHCAQSYRVFRGLAQNPTTELVSHVSTCSYIDTTALPGERYYYRVKAVNSAGESGYSSNVNCLWELGAPNIGFVQCSLSGIVLAWDSVPGASYYHLFRSSSPSGEKTPIGSWQSGISHMDSTGDLMTTYYYFVQAAVDSGGVYHSGYSAPASGFMVPEPPSSVQASDGTSADGVFVTWNASRDADSYEVYRYSSLTGLGQEKIGWNITSTGFLDTTGIPGVKYYYQVKTVHGSASSFFADDASDYGYRKLARPVISYSATSIRGVHIFWENVTGASHYRVYRADLENGEKTCLDYNWQSDTSFIDLTAVDESTYYYFVEAAVDSNGANPSGLSMAFAGTCNMNLANALTFSDYFAFSTGGSAEWYWQYIQTHDDFGAAQSGTIGDNQASVLQATVSGPAKITFWWHVSCESGDGLSLAIDGVELDRVSGLSYEWTKCAYFLDDGEHTITWTYGKNAFSSGGDDAGFVDEVERMEAACPAYYEKVGNEIWYYDVVNGNAVIAGCNRESGDLVIPDMLGGHSVTGIGEFAFYESSIISVVLPHGVESIGENAFACRNLEAIAIPSTVLDIGRDAFSYCSNLQTVCVEQNDEDRIRLLLENSGFDTSEVNFVTKGWSADIGVRRLTYASDIGTALWKFDYTVNDENPKDIIITNKVYGAGDLDFRGLPDGYRVVYVGSVFRGDATLTSFVEPDGLQCFHDYGGNFVSAGNDIPTCAFMDCTSLTNWVGGGSVRGSSGGAEYDQGTFAGCTELESPMEFPLMTCVPPYFFHNCRALPEATFGDGATLSANCFYQCTSLTNLNGIGWSTLTSVPESSLTGTKISGDLRLDNVESIGAEAFYCTEITSLYMPKAKGVGSYSLADCPSLKNVVIGELSTVGDHAFLNANGRLAVHVLGGMPPETFGAYAFNTPSNEPEKTPCVFIHTKNVAEIAAWKNKCFALKGSGVPDSYWKQNVRPSRTIGLVSALNQHTTMGSFYLAIGNQIAFVIMVK